VTSEKPAEREPAGDLRAGADNSCVHPRANQIKANRVSGAPWRRAMRTTSTGLVKGERFAVDASVMEANASRYHG
jgi:hypothetical protein